MRAAKVAEVRQFKVYHLWRRGGEKARMKPKALMLDRREYSWEIGGGHRHGLIL
jgi:hypothetical protein